MNQNLIGLKAKVDTPTGRVEHFNTSLSVTIMTNKLKSVNTIYRFKHRYQPN